MVCSWPPTAPCVDAGSGPASAFGLATQTTRGWLAGHCRLDLGWHRRQGYDFTELVALYVREDGNDSNPGTMPALALRTVTKALSLAREGTHIHVAPGTYEQDTGETFPLRITRWGVQIIGEDSETTFLHARVRTNLVHVLQSHGDSGMANLSLTGGFVFYNRFRKQTS